MRDIHTCEIKDNATNLDSKRKPITSSALELKAKSHIMGHRVSVDYVRRLYI